MSEDTLTVRTTAEAELDADSADLSVVIEGSSVFSGDEAFKKAKEVRELVESLKQAGVNEQKIKLRSVEVNSQSLLLIKSSAAKYRISIKMVKLELLPAILSAIAGHKGAKLTRLEWNYSQLQVTRRRLRQDALRDALAQARLDAEVLGVDVLGIHRLEEAVRDRDYNREYVDMQADFDQGAFGRARAIDVGFQLGNSTTVKIELKAEFRVSTLTNVPSVGS